MALYEFRPEVALRDLVRTYRIVNFVFGADDMRPYKPYPPKPEHCLTFYPRDTEEVVYVDSNRQHRNVRAVIFGQQTEVSHRYVGREFLLFQIVFQPGGLYRLTGIPSEEFNNSYLDAELVFGTQLRGVNELLASAGSHADMIGIVNAFLFRCISMRLLALHPVDTVNRFVFQAAEGQWSVDHYASQSCMSPRQYARVFKERMGVSPKYFYNLVRFENAFRMKNMHPHLDWLTIALHTGYHDYQHLSKSFQQFTGHTPNAFYLLDSRAPERKFGVVDTY